VTPCLFAADLHGKLDRYQKLFEAIERERPHLVFLGGDLLPPPYLVLSSVNPYPDFLGDFLAPALIGLRDALGSQYPRILVILGNDDPRIQEAAVLDLAARRLWEYVHERRVRIGTVTVHGYAYVPPSPFRLKDWERYDVSRFVDPGCLSPEEGERTFPVTEREARLATIERDVDRLAGDGDLGEAVFLFHSPPHGTKLDRAALDGQTFDHVPLDVHVGSIAIRRFIEARQPRLTLHGHVHESARLTGAWRDRIGATEMFSAAHDGPELALIRFDLDDLADATRTLT
jgi:Icc-related predicted phosphoesterase